MFNIGDKVYSAFWNVKGIVVGKGPCLFECCTEEMIIIDTEPTMKFHQHYFRKDED